MESIAARVFRDANPGRMYLIKWLFWFMRNEIDFDLFVTFYGGINNQEYLEKQFRLMQDDKTAWYMGLNDPQREKLVNLAIEHYAK